MKNERVGEIYIYCEMALWAIFPIVTQYTTRLMPPLLFAAVSIFVTGICLFSYFLFRGKLAEIKNKKYFIDTIPIAVFIIIVPLSLIFIGASMTSGINTAILLQTELLFTFIICGIFSKETITLRKGIGAVAIVAGATAILFNGAFNLKLGDFLIIAGTVFFPIGNIFQKKALNTMSPAVILLIRSILGAPVLVALSFIFEKYELPLSTMLWNNLLLILISAILVHTISKILWFEGLKRLDITKAVAIGTSAPAFSLLYAFVFLKEIPTIYQLVGLAIILTGLFITTRPPSLYV